MADTAIVDVKPATSSKINWTQAAGLIATGVTLASKGKLNLDADTVLTIIVGIQGVTQIATLIMRTYFTTTVTPQSVPAQPAAKP